MGSTVKHYNLVWSENNLKLRMHETLVGYIYHASENRIRILNFFTGSRVHESYKLYFLDIDRIPILIFVLI